MNVPTGRGERGHQAEDADARDRQRRGEEENASVHRRSQPSEIELRQPGNEKIRGPEGEKQSAGGGGRPQHDAFNEQLPDELPPRCTDRGTNADFQRSRSAARQQEVRHVGTGDEENESSQRQEETRDREQLALFRWPNSRRGA